MICLFTVCACVSVVCVVVCIIISRPKLVFESRDISACASETPLGLVSYPGVWVRDYTRTAVLQSSYCVFPMESYGQVQSEKINSGSSYDEGSAPSLQ